MEKTVLKNITLLVDQLIDALNNNKCLLAQTLTLEIKEELEKLQDEKER